MNKIYKVIWSKVKHQYVVVSELAHSNGKQSRTSRNSIRSRIAALVVCGAIAAFGVFSALPNSAFAEVAGGEATQSQYIAIATDSDSKSTANYGGYTYYKKSVSINGQTKYYYVRKGYDISVVYGKRYAGADNGSAYIIDAKKNAQYDESSDQGLLQAYQTTTSKGQITTLTGVNIEDLNTGVYGGASNAGGVDTPSDFGYHIKVNGPGQDTDGYIKVSDDLDGAGSGQDAGVYGNTNFETYFSHNVTLENDGTYSYTHGNEKVTVPTNKVYSIDGKLGVFTDAKGNLYTGDVYGDHNEILLSAVGKGNKIYSYWGTKVNDPTQTIGNMTVQEYNYDRKKLQDQAAAYHGDDITNIAVGGKNNKGTISLNRVGQYNDQTGKYETTDPVPGTITVTSTGGTGGSGVDNDVKIKFSNTENPDGFSVDAGSKVEAVQTEGSDKISAIKINGEEYKFGGGSSVTGGYVDEDGNVYINQEGDTPGQGGKLIGKITVSGANGLKVTANRIDGNKGINYEVSNNLTVNSEAGEQHKNGGNWTITDSQGERPLTFTNTTLDTANSGVVADTKVQSNDKKTTYGQDYKVVDTDGNVVDIKDVASASTLKNVDIKVNNNATDIDTLQAADELNVKYDSKNKTSVTLGGANGTQIHNVADGTDTKDAVNLGQLKNNIYDKYLSTATINKENGTLDLTVTNGNGEGQSKTYNLDLKGYIGELDDYVDEVKISDDKQSLVLKRRNGTEMSVDIADLAGAGLSTSDYHLIGSGEDGTGTYSPDKDGNIELQVKDEKTGTISKVKLEDIASADDVAGNTSSITEINNTLANGVVKYDYDSETKQYKDSVTLKGENGSQIHNVADGTDTKDAVNLGQLKNNIYDKYLSTATINKENGTLDLTVTNGNGEGQSKTYNLDLKGYIGELDDYVDEVKISDDKQSLVLKRRNGTEMSVDIADLAGAGLSTSDYHLIGSGEDGTGTYSPDKDGNIELQVKDEKTGTISKVKLEDIASADDVAGNTSSITEINNTLANGVVKYDYDEGTEQYKNSVTLKEGTQIHNLAAGTEDTDAVNLGQLNAVNSKVDAGWKATAGETSIDVKPTKDEDGNNVVPTLNFAGDNNITVTADTTNKAIQVALNDKVYLGGDHTEDSRNIVLDGDRGVIGLGSTIALDGRDGTAVIGGVNITTTAEEGTGKPVSTINGLSNTTWTGTTETPNRAATEGQLEDLSDTVNTGWYVADKNTAEDSTTGNFAVKPGETLTFNGDDNIDVEAKDHEVNVSLNDNITLGEGNSQININGNPENGEAALSIGDKFVVEQNGTTTIVADDGINNRPSQAQLTPDTTVTIAPSGVTFAGDDKGTTIIEGQKITSGGIVINGEDIYDKTTGIVTKGTITGLSNTTWDGKTDNASRVATEGQLKAVSDDVNAGWIATDSQNHEVNITPDNNKLNFAGDENVTVTAANNEIKVALNDDIVLGDYLNGGDGVLIGGSSGTISATNSITVGEDQGLIIDGQKEEIQGLSNTTWNEDVANAVERDSVAASTAATQGQLQEVSKVANAGWNASDGTNSISVKPNETLNFVGDENLTVSADGTDKKLKVSLNDNITLGEGPNQIQLNGAPGANDPALSVGTDKFVVDQDGSLSVSDKFNVDAETGNIYAANNSGSAIMMNDDSVALNAGGNGIAISDEGILLNTNGINEDIKLVTKGTSVSVDSNGTTFTNVNTNETTNIDGGTINVGDKLVVDQDGTTTIAVNDGTVMGNNTTMTVNKDGVAFSAYGNGTTVIDGQTIYAGGVVINNNGSGTINGLTNTTWDDELAKQVANSEELQSTAATQGQLQQAVSEVSGIVNKGWTAKAGDNDGEINITPGDTLNFEGDGNITVSATGGTSNELKFGLNDDITLGNPKAGNTEGERSFTINTTNPEGYVPESYKTGSGADFIDENGGFMLFATNTQGYGVFGVTAKGSAWAKDFKTYTTDIYGNNTQYSLNDVGDAVAQMSSYYNKENGKSYTVFSRYLNEAEKDNPFATVDENATRDIPLALRDDGAVLIGATIKGDDFTDNGIRINAETETTYDGDGNEVTNNIATITGLENTTWTPPEPEQSQIATFADDTPKTSRAATEAQLDDLYSSVVGYNVENGKVNTSHVTLGGTKDYKSYESRDVNGTKTYSGGVTLDNVAYATGEDGSEAVNVDYLNNAIKDAVKDGPVASNEKHLDTSKTYTPDKTTGTITINEVDGTGAVTGNQLVINDVASKAELDSLKTGVGDRNYNNVTDTTPIANGDSVTTAIGKLNNSIKGVTQDVINNSISGGHVDETGKVVLEKGEGENKSEVTTDIQLTDSEVSGVTLEKDTETGKNVLTITSTDKYDKNKTSSVTVSGLEIASTDDIKDVTGVASSEDLKDAYKDADKDGNATTEYITDSESMVEADVALDHAIQDVAGTSYANDMVLSNRIDSVEKRLGNVEERIDKVGAMAAAIANLRTMGFDPEAPTEIAIGVGQYKSETGIAIGVFHYPNQDFMLSASLSSSGDELMGGIGATWKLGRKSAAERAKDEEARHLEQAEEMKKLAQQEKVKAQAQRHAKLLAERQQASQKNA